MLCNCVCRPPPKNRVHDKQPHSHTHTHISPEDTHKQTHFNKYNNKIITNKYCIEKATTTKYK